MTEFEEYCKQVIKDSIPLPPWKRDLALEMMKELWDNDVVVDYVWCVVSSYPIVKVSAVVIDNNEEVCEARATWEYDKSQQSKPTASPWVLVDLELLDSPTGLVSQDDY